MSTAAWLMVLAALSPRQTPDLGEAAASVAALWAEADVTAITDLGATAGIRLQLLDQRYLPMSGRRAAAALREFFSSRRAGVARVIRIAEVGGEPGRAFAELDWTPNVQGTPRPERFVLFVGFTLEEGGWRISEIRLLQ